MKNRMLHKILFRFGLIAFLAGIIPGRVKAQNGGITANAPAVVTVDEAFSYTITGEVQGEIDIPHVHGVYILGGPNQMVSYQSSNINGKLQNTLQVTYTYMMKIDAEGDYIIPPATLTANNKTYKTNEVRIKVIKGTSHVESTAPQGKSLPSQEGKPVIVRQIPSKANVYVGEQLVLATKVYVRERLQITNLKTPSYEGFWNADLEADKAAGRDVVNGLTYSSQIIDRQLLTAQKTGNLKLDPVKMDVMIQKMVRKKSNPFGDIFDDPFFNNAFNSYQTVPDNFVSNPVTIHVKPLPPGAPSSFDGAVGDYELLASLSRDSTMANESVTLKVTLSGSGNLPLLQPVKVDFPPDLEVFDPKTDPKFRNTLSGSVGSVAFEYLIIPRNRGNFRIAPVEFTFFDPSSGKYITRKSKEFNLKVTGEKPGEGSSALQQVPQGFFRDEVKNLGNDIRFIKTGNPVLTRKDESLLHSPWMLVLPAGIILLVILFATRRRRAKKQEDINYLRNRRARKLAIQRLKTARHLLDKNEEGFYEEILRASWGYLSDKFGVDTSDLSRESIQEKLNRYGLPDDLEKDLWALIDECEFSQFAPGEAGDKNEIYYRAENILYGIEENI